MESFFYAGSCLDAAQLRELLLRRYHTLDFMKDMDLWEFIELYNQARKKDQEERLYQQWCAMLPQFAEYMPFEEFYDDITGANIDRRPTETIIAEIKELHRQKGEGNGA